jgi:anaerobic magnesium-protoporphyrin IX monomethyl ester cyclase
MNVAVINPPYIVPFIREGRCQSPQNYRKNSVPQMTPALIAGVLRNAGYTVRVFDAIALDLSAESIAASLAGSPPDLLLVNTTTPTIDSDLAFIATLKRRFPGARTVAFGVHVTALDREVMESAPSLDAVIRGVPEWASLDLAAAAAAGNWDVEIPGCTMRTAAGIVRHPDRIPRTDLDGLGFPAWDLLPLDQYVHPVYRKRYLPVNISRGCRHRCIFCVGPLYYGRTMRRRSPASVVAEIRKDVEAFSIRHFWFYAEDFTEDPDFVRELCRALIDARLKIIWWSNTRVDTTDPGLFALMRKAGCRMLSIGGESGCPDMLKAMRKGAIAGQLDRTVKMLRKAGIDSVVYYIFGLPGETERSVGETVAASKRAGPDYVEFYPAVPYPGTVFFEQARRENRILSDDWSLYHYGEFVVDVPGLPPDIMRARIRKAYRSFYLRPRYAWTMARKLRHPASFLNLVRFGWGYLKSL